MKKVFTIALLSSSLLTLVSCDVLQEVASTVLVPSSTTTPQLTNTEVISGLKEALTVGIQNSVKLTSVQDGFLKDPLIKIPFPDDAIKVREKALEWGFTSQVEKFETSLNRAAEQASKEALSIFTNAITNMSVSDGFAILNGGKGAATNFLKTQTSTQLMNAFKPKVESAIASVKVTEYWSPIITKYNSAMTLTGGTKINPDLTTYITQKAINGLFSKVEIEENKIRENPAARISALLTKVFGSIKI